MLPALQRLVKVVVPSVNCVKVSRITVFNCRVLHQRNGKCLARSITTVPQSALTGGGLTQLKVRPQRKKKLVEEEKPKLKDFHKVVAFATAEEYSLEGLLEGLVEQGLYRATIVDSNPDALHAVAEYDVDADKEPREIFFFREGSVVMWNTSDMENSNLLNFLKSYEQDSYSHPLVLCESEILTYKYLDQGKKSMIDNAGEISIPPQQNGMEKYTFSDGIALSVKLGVWEALLDDYIKSVRHLSEDLKRGFKIRLSREQVLKKHGELYALRHLINLRSDLLDVPDFYWDRDDLESLYCQVLGYFSIAKRTKVANEKLNHCIELIELISSHLSDKHHIRLEWMIILLIMVEVGFETLHLIDKYI